MLPGALPCSGPNAGGHTLPHTLPQMQSSTVVRDLLGGICPCPSSMEQKGTILPPWEGAFDLCSGDNRTIVTERMDRRTPRQSDLPTEGGPLWWQICRRNTDLAFRSWVRGWRRFLTGRYCFGSAIDEPPATPLSRDSQREHQAYVSISFLLPPDPHLTAFLSPFSARNFFCYRFCALWFRISERFWGECGHQ